MPERDVARIDIGELEDGLLQSVVLVIKENTPSERAHGGSHATTRFHYHQPDSHEGAFRACQRDEL